MLLLFDVLFIFFGFQLTGGLNKKLGLLATCNILGLFWSFILNSIAFGGAILFGEVFTGVFRVILPLLSSMWIVSIWSLSLAYLSISEKQRR